MRGLDHSAPDCANMPLRENSAKRKWVITLQGLSASSIKTDDPDEGLTCAFLIALYQLPNHVFSLSLQRWMPFTVIIFEDAML